MFCAGVTVQLGLACLRAARLETEGDILPSGLVNMTECLCVGVCASGTESTTVMGANGESV